MLIILKYQSPYEWQLIGKNKTARLHNLCKNQGLLCRYLHLPSVFCWVESLAQLLGSHLSMVAAQRTITSLGLDGVDSDQKLRSRQHIQTIHWRSLNIKVDIRRQHNDVIRKIIANKWCRKGDPFQDPKLGSCLTLKNELSEETHVLTKQGILLGRGPGRTALSHGLQSQVLWWWD